MCEICTRKDRSKGTVDRFQEIDRGEEGVTSDPQFSSPFTIYILLQEGLCIMDLFPMYFVVPYISPGPSCALAIIPDGTFYRKSTERNIPLIIDNFLYPSRHDGRSIEHGIGVTYVSVS